jgi:hypothetical protein
VAIAWIPGPIRPGRSGTAPWKRCWCHYGAVGSWKRRLSDDERSVLLSELLLRHPELAAEAEEITSALLVVNDQELTGEITTRLRALCPRSPVSVDAGRERVLEVLQPYIDDLTWRKERGARRAAADTAAAVMLGLYECREDTDEDMLLVRMGLPGAADDLARTVYDKVRPLTAPVVAAAGGRVPGVDVVRGELEAVSNTRSARRGVRRPANYLTRSRNPGLRQPFGPLVSSHVRECEHHWPVAYHGDGQLGPGDHRPGPARLHRVR